MSIEIESSCSKLQGIFEMYGLSFSYSLANPTASCGDCACYAFSRPSYKDVFALQEHVHPHKGKDHPHKSYDGHIGRLFPPPSGSQPAMKHARIKKPENQRPGLLRIPVPVGAPGIFCPDRACDNAEGQQWKSKRDGPVVQIIQQV